MGEHRVTQEAETCVDAVAGERADALGARSDLAGSDGPALVGHTGEAPCRLTQEVVTEIQDVYAQDHQVLAPSAPILLAPSPQLEQLADRSLWRSAS